MSPPTNSSPRPPEILDSIQQNLYERATEFRDANTRAIDSKEEFYAFFTPKNSAKPEIHGGFALAHWDGSRAVEEQIKNDLKVTIRCIPFDDPAIPPSRGHVRLPENPSPRRVIWAKAYTDRGRPLLTPVRRACLFLIDGDRIETLQPGMVFVVH